MNYYDANAVAYESAAERYTNIEPPTLCDCGSIAEHGSVYCKDCLDANDFIMRNAVKLLRHNRGISEDEAEQAVCHWIENKEEYEERRNAKKL